MKFLQLVACALCLSGCDSPDAGLRRAVLGELKDPNSAIFGDVIVYKARACIGVNSKNSYGGYTGETVAHLKRLEPDQWRIDTMDGPLCSQEELAKLQAADDVENKMREQLIALLHANNWLPRDKSSIYDMAPGPCQDYARVMNQTLQAVVSNTSPLKERTMAIYESGMARLRSGACG